MNTYRFRVWVGTGRDREEVEVELDLDHDPTEEDYSRAIDEGLHSLSCWGAELIGEGE